MAKSDDISSIADASHPNAGRIYDYLIGGKHNFEIDRQAAQQILDIAPFVPDFLKLIRWFLGEATRRLVSDGYSFFLDFASGLPTRDHIHEVAPKGTKVVYSDIDPVTVEYAKEIIAENPHTRYIQCDAAEPETLLESGIVDELFGGERKIAVGFNGIAYFLKDEQISHTMQVLHDWVGKGSKLFVTDADQTKMSEKVKPLYKMYENMGQPAYTRSKERMQELIKPWKIAEPGMLPMEKWLDMATSVEEKMKDEWGFGFYGMILVK